MSDITPVLEDGAKDLAKSGEQAGKAVEKHLGQDIGGGLDGAAKNYKDVDDLHGQKFDEINPNKAADGAPGRPGDGGRPAGGGPAAGEPAGGGDLGADSDAGQLGDGREDGSGGQSDDPIDLVTGEMFLPQRDLLLPGVLPLVLERRHGSGYRRGQLFGATWSSTLDQRIQVDDDGIHYAAPDGRVLHYPVPSESAPLVLPSHGPRWPLSWNRREDRISIEQTDLGRTLEFPPGPVPELCRPLAAIADRHGNRIMVAYDGEGVPTDIHHSGGYHIAIGSVGTRGGPRISTLKITDRAGGPPVPIVDFRYDRAGRLVETADSSGPPLVFEYDEADRITRWTDRNGHYYAYHYREDGRVDRAEGSGGYLACALDYDLAARTTTITDSLGFPSVYHWNDRLQTVKVVDPLGNTTLTESDKYGNILSTTDALGRTTRADRDENGDPVRITRPDQSTITIAYNAHRQPLRVTGPNGGTWTYEYNGCGTVTATTDPTGAITRYTHDDYGRLTSVTDPCGAVTTVVCDKAGLPASVTDPLGGTVRITRDHFGRIASVTNPLGATTTSTWTVDGRPLTRTLPDGTGETWTYDAEGNLLAHVDPAGATTRFEYGAFDVQTARTDPDGARYRFGHDARLHLTTVTAANDLAWQYTYDMAGNLVAETDFNGSTRTYTVDACGDLASSANAAGQSIQYHRDLLGRVVERHADGAVHRYSYDAAGQLARAEAPGTVLEYTRDRLGRILAESADGRSLRNTFDAVGRRLTRGTPAGVASRWAYDAAGRPLSLAGTGGGLAFEYDEAGREVTRALGAAASLTQTFDEIGRLTGQGIWAFDQPGGGGGGAAGNGADQPGAWRSVQTRGYAYRPDGTPFEITDRLRGTRRFELDAAGRVTALTALGSSTAAVTPATWAGTYTYDSLGNLARAAETDQPSSDPAAASAGDTTSEREHHGTLIRRAGRTTYDYDQAGRLVKQVRRTLSGQARTWTYVWDADDHLIQATLPDGTVWRYGYDPIGRRRAKCRLDEAGAVVETIWFTWDGPRVAEETRTGPDGRATTLTWDYQPGTFTPAAQTRQSWATGAGQAQIDREFHAIVTDLVGTPMELVAADGRIAWHTSTSLWGRTITAPDSSTECPLRFPGQYHDAETGLHYNLHRYYDPATAGYLSPDPLGLEAAPNHHAYVDNPLTWSDPLGLAPYNLPEGYTSSPALSDDPWSPQNVQDRQDNLWKDTYGNDDQKLTSPQQANLAQEQGWTKASGRSHGQAVFTDGKHVYSYDVDGHNGGIWKKATSLRNLGSKTNRMGTYDVTGQTRIHD